MADVGLLGPLHVGVGAWRCDGAKIRPVTHGSRGCKMLWNILSERNIKTCAVNCCASFPAESISGVVVADPFLGLSRIKKTIWAAY